MPPVARRLAAIAWPQPAAAAGRLRAAAIHTSSFASRLPRRPLQNQLQNQLLKPQLQLLQAGRPRRRYYQSLDHPSEPPPQDRFSPDEQAILSAAYRHIPEHGFSDRTLALGARDAGYPDISTSILPDGVFSLVRWHLVSQRTALATRASAILGDATPVASLPSPLPPADVIARAERLTWERLMGNEAVVGRWQEALAIMAQPSYMPASLRELALLVDEIWAQAGDTAVDPSWYTKRASLSAIYASSELFMTTDTNPDFAATRDFLHRRFHESQELRSYLGAAGQWLSFTASAGLNVLRSKGVPI